ncbi:glyoxalase/bleomycin resistance/dioxygenase family protein [Candidatus Soleaferrea massiliensis]|uniref:glyoxalase/bleomycin resistance/dioxygenase family protein n=1 Tax=Candidatus Soleaferrea massiliensis TaxID=1470354 RepID=UPI00058F6B95|nr:glyoxalase/bleomycin resistance/dioxygenase family protein [Candidatus Soleaferrea massiliensis]
MNFQLALLAVRDVEVSKKFYQDLFDQEVELDLGRNVTFSGGFAVQQDFEWLTGIEQGTAVQRSHNMELYFEVDDFDAFMQRLEAYGGVGYVHPPKTYEWKQRVVRIYDPDFHIIEIGESMGVIARRYLGQGLSVEEVSALIQHPPEFVQAAARGDV